MRRSRRAAGSSHSMGRAACSERGSTCTRASLGADPFEMSTMSSPLFHSRQKETVMRFLEQRGSGYRWEYLGEFGVFCGADDFL